MCIPYGFYQGNRSEYLAIPALSKLGFTVPVPRQEDHFGIDFIVHLAKIIDDVVTPTGRAFGIQIKSNRDPLTFNTQGRRDCLYSSSLPFFLGVVSRQDLTLSVYNTLNRLHFFWMRGPKEPFSLIVDDEGNGIPKPDFGKYTGGTGKPILEIDISEPRTPQKRMDDIEVLQSTMQTWIDLENDNLSLKEQGIALLFWPSTYAKNTPLRGGIESKEYSYTKFAKRDSLPHVCRATEKALTSLSFYLRKLPRDNIPADVAHQMDGMHPKVDSLKAECELFRTTYAAQCIVDRTASATLSFTSGCPDPPTIRP